MEGSFGGRGVSDDDTVSLRRYALEGVSHFARSNELQELVVGCGMMWPLVRYMLGYDPSLEQIQTTQADEDDIMMSQAASSTFARLSARAIGMLCGMNVDGFLRQVPGHGKNLLRF